MKVKILAEELRDKVISLQPIVHLQVQTLSDFNRWCIDPSIKLGTGVSKNHLDQLRQVVTNFLTKELRIAESTRLSPEEKSLHVKKTADFLRKLRLELAFVRSNYYLQVMNPIYDRVANPNVVWDTYLMCTNEQDLPTSHLKGASIWADRALKQLKIALAKDNKYLSSDQEEEVLRRFLNEALLIRYYD